MTTDERGPLGSECNAELGSGCDYHRMLEEGFAAWREVNPDGTPENRVAYLADYVFNFTTYDDEKAKEFGVKALEVCRAISDRKTFEYIADPANYRWFLLMVNMPFFARRLNWGTSVRGAWWDTSAPNETELDTNALWLDGEQLTKPLKFSTEQWCQFIAALLAFAAEEPNDQVAHRPRPGPGAATAARESARACAGGASVKPNKEISHER